MIRACDIFKSYGNSDNPLPVLRGISLEIEEERLRLSWGLPAQENLHC
ncbi:MAG: hypothetical protein ACLRMZ_15610 [Blautia marasmi]